MTPDELSKKMAECWCKGRTKEEACQYMLRIVLDNINDIVTLDYSSVRGCGGSPDIELKPDFANFMRGEK